MQSDGPVVFNTDMDKVSYIIGQQIGNDFKAGKLTGVDISAFGDAIDDAIAEKDPKHDNDTMSTTMQTLMMAMRADTTGSGISDDIDMGVVSYAIGWQIGNEFRQTEIEGLNTSILSRAVSDVMNESEPAISEEEAQPIMEVFSNEMREKQMAAFEKAKQENGVEASAFLADNSKKNGVVTLEDSLQYEVITKGSGPKPKPEDVVRVNYRGTFADGSEFDSSREGSPAEFPVGGVIMGWQRALQLMPVGSKWRVSIPPMLAYGENGRPGAIPPNKLLVFEMELLDIVKKEKPE